MSGFDQKIYLSQNELVKPIKEDLKDFVLTMESIKLNQDVYVLLGYEKGRMELYKYQNEPTQSMILISELFADNPHSIDQIIFDYQTKKIFVCTEESEIY